MKKLQEMNKKELSQLALEKGLKLSYKDKNDKRQRFTINELREMLKEKLVFDLLNRYESSTTKKIENSLLYGISGTGKSFEVIENNKIESPIKVSENEFIFNSVENLKNDSYLVSQEKSVFEIFKEQIQNSKSLIELKKLKNEISQTLNLNQKIKSKIIKSNSAMDYNKLIFLINKKKIELV